MQKCPDCQYQTNVPDRMKHHLKEHGHGRTQKRKGWKGDKASKGKKSGK